MTLRQGLVAARPHLVFLAGLALALVLMRWADRAMAEASPAARERLLAASDLAAGLDLRSPPAERARADALTPEQTAVARAAWTYFVRNTRDSGLIDSVDKFPSTTLWDQGSAMMGAISARELGLIDEEELERRMGNLLDALLRAPLVAGTLPNRGYDTRTLLPVDYAGKPLPAGAGGWSALDLGRFGVPLTWLVWRAPALAPKVRALLGRWRLSEATKDGELVAGDLKGGQVVRAQEGRLGYEQYAAASLFLLGADVARARDFRRHVALAEVSGRQVPFDDRVPEAYGGVANPVLSEPWILLGLEFGLDGDSRPLAQAVLGAQEARFHALGILTAVSEDNLEHAPYFVYSTVLEGGEPWRVYDTEGRDQPGLRMLSTKAALGWAALFTGDYAARLEASAQGAAAEPLGLYSGRFESDGTWNKSMTANTSGIVLEALAYRLRGPLLRDARTP